MFNIFINSWRVKEIRSKILYTLMILAIVRLGAHIAIPGINVLAVRDGMEASSVGTLYNIISGGANARWSIFAMGIGPYITSSIIMQLLTIAIPKLEQLSKEGEDGRKKIQAYSRVLTIFLAIMQGSGLVFSYRGIMLEQSIFVYISAVIVLVSGTALVMWFAEQITAKGIGNGSSMIIFINIISSLPMAIGALYGTAKSDGAKSMFVVLLVVLIFLGVLVFTVLVQHGERKIPVQYSSKMAGRKSIGGRSTFMPIKVNTAGVISIIFAVSLLQFPEMVAQFVPVSGTFGTVIEFLRMTHPVGALLYILLIIFFTYFYTSIVINPNEIAENMKKNGGFIPGIRPGQPTSDYITRVVNRVTLVGAISFSLLAAAPILLQWIFKIQVGFGGSTLIIVVGVCLDIVKSLESQLLQRHYKGFLNNN